MAISCKVERKRSAALTPHTHTPTHPHTPKSKTSSVWTFTNKKELTNSEFINYFERKVFRTIRKYQLLPSSKIFKLKKQEDLNTAVLKHILEAKFQVEFSSSQNISSDNLSESAESIFKKIIKGNFNIKPKTSAPLIQLSDKELELYAKLKNIKGTSRKQNKKIQDLFGKFLSKNQDLEVNILKASEQLS